MIISLLYHILNSEDLWIPQDGKNPEYSLNISRNILILIPIPRSISTNMAYKYQLTIPSLLKCKITTENIFGKVK